MLHDRLLNAHAGSAGATAAWRLVQDALRAEFAPSDFHAYVEPLHLLLVEDDQLVFLAHSQTQQLWLDREARRQIESRLSDFIDVGKPIAIRTFKELSPLAQDYAKAAEPTLPAPGRVRPREADQLGEGETGAQRFTNTFDGFCVGASNQRAVALARMIASKSSAATQLTLFHGDPGVGKTHLAEAICASVAAEEPSRPILMIKALAFFEQFQAVIRQRPEDAPAFKSRMRAPSLIVIDDVQHLAAKRATEEEFLALLAHHLDQGNQVVLTADAGPEALEGFSDRLKHRLRCATDCAIDLPDMSLRRAILDARIAVHARSHSGFSVEDAAVDMIAARLEASGRELDGAVAQLVVEWEMSQSPITTARAEATLRNRFGGGDKRIMIDHVREAAAKHFKMSQQELLRRTRERAVAYPRQVAMYCACKLTSQSLPNIAKYIGNFDHTTVLHARKKISRMMIDEGNDAVRRDVDAVMKLARQLA